MSAESAPLRNSAPLMSDPTPGIAPAPTDPELIDKDPPPWGELCPNDWKAAEYDKTKFEGVWLGPGFCYKTECAGKASVSNHCMCYTCVCFYCCGIPMIPDLTWTCGKNCWMSEGGSTYIYGEGDVVYHAWLCCPWEKWTRVDTGGPPSHEGITMER